MTDGIARFERMAAAAAQRRRAQAEVEAAIERRRWARQCADVPRQIAACHADMTLGEAMRIKSGPAWACACSGPAFWPAPPGTPCSCALMMMRVDTLCRGAHILANVMLRAAERRGRSTP